MSSVKTVETLLTELGLHERASRVAENVWTLQKGSATVQIVAAPEFVVATAKVLPVGWLLAKELAFIIGNVAMRADEWDAKLHAMLKASG